MTDLSPPDDEMISSYLDREATPDEVARIEADPDLLGRVEQLRSAAELVATPVAGLDASQIDRVIDAALAESSTSDSVIDLRAETQRRNRFRQRLVTAAAGVLVLAVAVPTLIAINGATDSDDSTADEGFAEFDAPADAEGADDSEEPLGDFGLDAATAPSADMDAPDGAMTDDISAAEADGPADDAADEESAVDPASRADARLRDLDVLPQVLSAYSTTAELIADVNAFWVLREPGGSSNLVPPDEFDPDATACSIELIDVLGWPEVPMDLEVIDVADETISVALAAPLGAGGIIAFATPPDCVVTEVAELPAD